MSARTALDSPPRRMPIGYAVALSAALHTFVIGWIEAGPAPGVPAAAVTIEAVIVTQAGPQPSQASPSDGQQVVADAHLPQSEVQAVAAGSPAVSSPPKRLAPAIRSPKADLEPHAAPATSSAAGDPVATALAHALDAPLARDTTYHAIAALDRPPMPLARPDVCYPGGASGEVVYELWIGETGAVDRATVVSSAGEASVAAAAERCRQLAFAPAMKDGRAVRSKVRFVVGPRIESASR